MNVKQQFSLCSTKEQFHINIKMVQTPMSEQNTLQTKIKQKNAGHIHV